MISPTMFVLSLLALTVGAYWLWRRLRHHQKLILRELATRWQMHYAAEDLFRLAGRLAHIFPVRDAADLRIAHVIYGVEGDCYRYYVTAEFTVGALYRRRRERRAVVLSEPREKDDPVWGDRVSVTLAPAGGTLLAQYEQLHQPASPKA
jgi:hypothetical protein